MKQIIFDCDSTVGLPGKPMDDVLALLYLLGNPDKAKVLGITCTFANGTAREVYGSTKAFLREIGREDIPLLVKTLNLGGRTLGGFMPLAGEDVAAIYRLCCAPPRPQASRGRARDLV